MRIDAIWNRARTDLAITTEVGAQDIFLWEHSVRVAENARRIALLPEVRAASPDEAAIVAAALYHDSSWITRLREGEIKRCEILTRPVSEAHREQAALIMERSIADLLPPDSLKRASRAIRSYGGREIESIEGQVVHDADHLDEFGLLSLWPIARRGTIEGKGVQAVIETWHAQKRYQFWQARLKDSFRFAPVRALAERRLETLERFMADLQTQHQGTDLVPEGVVKPTG